MVFYILPGISCLMKMLMKMMVIIDNVTPVNNKSAFLQLFLMLWLLCYSHNEIIEYSPEYNL